MKLHFHKTIEDEKLIEKFTFFHEVNCKNKDQWDWRGASVLSYSTGMISEYFREEFENALPKEYKFVGDDFRKFLNKPQQAIVTFGHCYIDHPAYSTSTNAISHEPIGYVTGGSNSPIYYREFTADDFITAERETVMVPKKRKSKRTIAIPKRWEKRHPFVIQGEIEFKKSDADPQEIYDTLKALNYEVDIDPSVEDSQVHELKEQVETLQSKIEELNKKVSDLEDLV